jgi:hypothetical protein
MVAKMGVSIALAGKAVGVPTVVFDDTEFAWLQRSFYAPLATVICTGLGFTGRFPGKQLRYNAYPQLAYTHPSRFKPDPNVLRAQGLEPDEPYVVLRLKAWGAALHDFGVKGPQQSEIVRLVEVLNTYGRPIISSERALPRELLGCGANIAAADTLHLLAFARLYVGEGASMAAEAACLGTPAIFLSPASRRGYLDLMEQRYGHVRTVRSVQQAIECAQAWLESSSAKDEARAAQRRILEDCEDPIEFMLRVVRDYGLHVA